MVLWTAFRAALTRFDKDKMAPEIALRNTIGFIAAVALGTVFGSPGAGSGRHRRSERLLFGRARSVHRAPAHGWLSRPCCRESPLPAALSQGPTAMPRRSRSLGCGRLRPECWSRLGTTAADLGAVHPGDNHRLRRPTPCLPVTALNPAWSRSPAACCKCTFCRPLAGSADTGRSGDHCELYAALSKPRPPPGASTPRRPSPTDYRTETLSHSLAQRSRASRPKHWCSSLNQAERLRLSLLTLLSLDRVSRRIGNADHHRKKAEARAALSADGSLAGVLQFQPPKQPAGLKTPCAVYEHTPWGATPPFFAALIPRTRHQLDTLAGQLRAVSRAACIIPQRANPLHPSVTSPGGCASPGWAQAARPILRFQSTVFRHAVRLALCVGAGEDTLLARVLTLQRTYWLTDDDRDRPQARFQRHASPAEPQDRRELSRRACSWPPDCSISFSDHWNRHRIALIAVFAFLLRWAGPANYGIFVTALSAMVVLLIAATGFLRTM